MLREQYTIAQNELKTLKQSQSDTSAADKTRLAQLEAENKTQATKIQTLVCSCVLYFIRFIFYPKLNFVTIRRMNCKT